MKVKQTITILHHYKTFSNYERNFLYCLWPMDQALAPRFSCFLESSHSWREKELQLNHMTTNAALQQLAFKRKQEAPCLLSWVQVLWEGYEEVRARKFLLLPRETKQCTENKSSWCACLPCPSWLIQTFFPFSKHFKM